MKLIGEVQTSGFRELGEALEQFTRVTSRNVAKRALDKGAEPIRDAWKAGVDVESGDLKESIQIGERKLSRSNRKFRRGEGQSVVERYVGINAEVNPRLAEGGGGVSASGNKLKRFRGYAQIEEFGDANRPANPAGRRAFASKKEAAVNATGEALRAEILKAAARAERKAARAAKKAAAE